MGGIKNKIKNLIKKVNIAYFSVIIIFIIMLLYIIGSIFLLKKYKNDFNNLKHDTEQAIKRLESKTDAFSSQLYRMRLMNQQYYLNQNNTNIENK